MPYALLPLAIYAASVAGIALVIARLRPTWSRFRLIAVSAALGPLLLLALLAIGFGSAFLYEPAPDDGAGIDARYHALGAYLFLAVVGVPILLAIGVLVGWLTSSMLKR